MCIVLSTPYTPMFQKVKVLLLKSLFQCDVGQLQAKEQYWIDMATCPAPSLKYWSPWSFGKPLIYERNALREALPQQMDKFLLKSIVAL